MWVETVCALVALIIVIGATVWTLRLEARDDEQDD